MIVLMVQEYNTDSRDGTIHDLHVSMYCFLYHDTAIHCDTVKFVLVVLANKYSPLEI